VLTSCPNLYFLNLTLLTLSDLCIPLEPHYKLKRLRLVLTSIVWLDDEKNFEILFQSIPTIERFSLRKLFSVTNSIDLLLNYDWLSTIFARYLPLLKQMIYHLYIFNLFNIDQTDFNKNLQKIHENFSNTYQNHSNFHLQIKQYNT
jgi:hypothetical protein